MTKYGDVFLKKGSQFTVHSLALSSQPSTFYIMGTSLTLLSTRKPGYRAYSAFCSGFFGLEITKFF